MTAMSAEICSGHQGHSDLLHNHNLAVSQAARPAEQCTCCCQLGDLQAAAGSPSAAAAATVPPNHDCLQGMPLLAPNNIPAYDRCLHCKWSVTGPASNLCPASQQRTCTHGRSPQSQSRPEFCTPCIATDAAAAAPMPVKHGHRQNPLTYHWPRWTCAAAGCSCSPAGHAACCCCCWPHHPLSARHSEPKAANLKVKINSKGDGSRCGTSQA
jgi:hypothetical protein